MADAPDKESFLRAQRLLAGALKLPGEERSAFLDAACAGDEGLRAEVESLLAASVPNAGFLEQDVPGVGLRLKLGTDVRTGGAHPTRIGQYRIGELLGEGGMGSVYEAEQAEPRRRVAIKLLKAGMASAQACRRFERETQFLGRLSHPAIAQVFEGGVHRDESGGATPWFAMEYVDGRTITTFAKEEGLSPRERIELMLQACDAVAHAHAQGILHRDLKPDNILVDASGRVRVLDFGVARALDEPEAQTAMLTRVGDIVGTLSYMSPEQSAGTIEAVDERSDVYALGVIAFELMTGKLPHDLDGLPLPDALGRIRDIEAERVSSLIPSLRGDLDVIISTALEKERDRRYGSATDFASDLRHYLLHEPIVARAPSVAYRFTRFARRNRTIVAGILGIMLTLAGAVVVTARYALSEAAQRRRADEQVFQMSRLAMSESKARRTTEQALVDLRRSEVQVSRELYRVQLAGAQSALREGDIPAARRLLEAAPQDFRGWEWQQLKASLDESLSHLQAPPGHKLEIAFTPDGESIVVANSRGVVRSSVPLGDVEDTWLPPPDTVIRDLSPDGRRVLISRGWEVWLRTLATGEERLVETRAHGTINFSRSGKLAWMDFFDDEEREHLLIADGRTGETIARFPLLEGSRWGWIGNDESFVTHAVRGASIVARHRSVRTGEVIHEFHEPPTGLAIVNPSGTLAVGTPLDTGRTCAWDLRTGERLDWLDQGPRLSLINHARFTPDGSRLLLVHDDGLTRMVDAKSGRPIAPIAQTDVAGLAHDPGVTPDGEILAVEDAHHQIVFVDTMTGRPVGRLHGQGASLYRLQFSPDGRTLATLDDAGRVWLWDVPSRASAGQLDEYGDSLPWRLPQRVDPDTLSGHESYIYDLAIDPSGTRLASTAWDGTLRLWDLASGRALATLMSPDPTPIYGHVTWNPEGTRLMSIHGETVSLWNGTTGELIASHALGGQALPVSSHSEPGAIAWHPTLPLVVVGTVSRQVHTFRVDEATSGLEATKWPMRGHTICFSADGRYLAAADRQDIHVWSIPDLVAVTTLEGSTMRIRRVAFSPDGTRLASTNDDGKLRSWSIPGGELVLNVDAHVGQAHGLAWSPDGTRLATGGSDRVINIWDVQGGAAVRALRGHELYVYSLAWSPNGELLVSGSGDTNIKLWDVAAPRVRLLARREQRRLRAELLPRVLPLLSQADSPVPLEQRVGSLPGLSTDAKRVALDLLLELSSPREQKRAAGGG